MRLFQIIKGSLSPKSYLSRRAARKAARDFGRMVQAYDDSIALARARHRPVAALVAAKSDFVHSCLRAELGL